MFNLNDGLLVYIFRNGVAESWHYYLAYIGFTLITILASYLLGSINSAIIISKIFHNDDIRKHGSGNAGMTNMLRTYGLGAAGLTLLGDVLKTALAISVAGVLFGFNYIAGISTGDGFCYIAGLFAVLGHIFPIYYRFKGGKGVLATAAMALILSPAAFGILLLLFVLIVWISKYVSLGSVTGAILYPIALHGYFAFALSATMPGLTALSSIVLAIIIVWCHRGNLQRIGDRTERKISFKKKPKPEEDASDDADA